MLSTEQKKEFRSELFRHLDGFVTAPTAFALHKQGIFQYLSDQKEVSLDTLAERFNANDGYLNVALRLMCTQGWLEQTVDNRGNQIVYHVNNKTTYATRLFPSLESIVSLQKYSEQFHPRLFAEQPFRQLVTLFDLYRRDFDIQWATDEEEVAVQKQVLKHIEGVLIAPTVVILGLNGMFHKYFMEASFRADEFHEKADSFSELLDFFVHLGWFTRRKDTFQFTEKGLFFARRASAYGVTVSYANTFRYLDELIFGNADVLRAKAGEPEIHVDRAMNVWGSGGAHATYFKKVDDIIISIFNRPIEQQPRGIVDMGCGNGAYLKHLYEVVESRTLRGEMLEDYPLFLVGADYNEEALKATRATLIQSDIWAKLLWGDIGRPDLLANELLEMFGIHLEDLLNVRTFLDHNRIWSEPAQRTPDRVSNSTGAFASRGMRLSNNDVEENLKEHFLKWQPYVRKFGLLVIELHTLPPDLAAQHVGSTPVTAYDATHGFSDQYIVEMDVFLNIAKEAGLHPDPAFQTRFPDSELATVSINLLKGK